jgi:hypothetical protein
MNASNPLTLPAQVAAVRSASGYSSPGLPPLPPKRSESTGSQLGNGNLIGDPDLLDPASPTDPTHFATSVSPSGDPYADLEGVFGRSQAYPGEEEDGQGVSCVSASALFHSADIRCSRRRSWEEDLAGLKTIRTNIREY